MSDVSVNRLGWTGFLIPERIATIEATSSDSPIVGPAIPSTGNTGTGALKTAFVRRAAATDDYTIIASRGGVANSDVLPAELILSQQSGSDSYYLGHMDPVVIWGHEYVGTKTYSRICRWGGYQGWTLGPVYSHSFLGDRLPAHDICSGAENQIIMVTLDNTTSTNVFITTSIIDRTIDDDTPIDTVSQVIPTSLFTAIDGIIRVRVGYFNGTCLLLATINKDSQYRVHQWASGDSGRSWKYIGSTEDTVDDFGFSVADIEGTKNGFYVALACQNDSASKSFRLLRITSPYEPVWSAEYTSVGTTGWSGTTSPTNIESSLTSSETGEVYFLSLSDSTAGNYHVGLTFVSTDLGQTWKQLIDQSASGYWLRMYVDTTVKPTRTDCVHTNGLVVFSPYFSAGARRYSVAFGGWSNHAPTTATHGSGLPIRARLSDESSNATAGWSSQWLPWQVTSPVDWGFSAAETGATTGTVDHLGIDFAGTATPAEGRTYLQNISEDAEIIHVHRFRIVCETTVETASNHHKAPIVVTVRSCDSPVGSCYGLIFAIDGANVRVFKETTTTPTLVDTHEFDSSAGSEFYIYAQINVRTDGSIIEGTGLYTICQRALSSYTVSDTILGLKGKLLDWNVVTGTVSSMTDIIGVSTVSSVEWGSWLATGQSATVYEFFHSEDLDGLAPANPTGSLSNTQGRQLVGNLLYMGKDVLVSPLGGIFNRNDIWTVEDDYEYDIQHVLSVDPGLVWRTTNVSAQVITAQLENSVNGPIVGLLLKGVRHDGELIIEGYDIEDGWIEFVPDTEPIGIGGIRAESRGSTLRPADGVGAVNTWSFRDNEFANAWASFDSANMYQVITNTGGKWDPDSLSTVPVIRCAGLDEVAISEDPLEIYPQDVLVLMNIGVKAIQAVRITFPTSPNNWPTGEDYRYLQRLLFGQVMVCGDDPDWQHSIRHDVAVETAELPSGRVRPKQKLPSRRVAEVSWTDGIDTSLVMKPSRDPNWIGGDVPWADAGSTPWQLQALLERINGEAGEVVYIPRRPTFTALESTGDYEILPRRHNFLHGRITSSVAHDAVQGEEDSTEIIRVGTITIREEV